MLVHILSLESLFHAWDFAKATGRDVVVSEPVSGYVLGLAGKVITPAARGYGRRPPVVQPSVNGKALHAKENGVCAGHTELGRPADHRSVPNYWHVYFAVEDTDATAARAAADGGQVAVEPFDIPSVGRSAVLADPQGAMFSVLTPVAQQ